jgi:hypothetical protein
MRFEDFIHNEMGSNKKDKPAKQKKEDICPICGGKIVMRCRCMIGHKRCENGHSYHYKNGQLIMGDGHGG